MIPKKFFAFIFVSAFLISCQKDIDNVDPVVTDPVISDSIYLAKIYRANLSGNVSDTFNIISYNYDNQKRVISMIDSSILSDGHWKFDYSYSYQNNDTIPFKSVMYGQQTITASNPINYDTIITYHFYDNSGRKLKDSIISSGSNYTGYLIAQFSYGNSRLYGNTLCYLMDGTPDLTTSLNRIDTAILDSYGNILSNRKHRLRSGQYQLSVISDLTFDNKVSVFSRLTNFKAGTIFPYGESIFTDLQHNTNRTSIHEQYVTNGTASTFYQVAYTNLYKSNGDIKEVVESVISNPRDPVCNSFEYTSL
jgi:hypothetical protein